jgi:hypothetical protein
MPVRNTPYPRYTIGHRDHAIFDLNKTPGLVQGIVKLADPKTVKVSEIADFDHLAPGQTRIFEAPERVEVVDFGGYHGRGGFVSSLETQVLELEAGSKLTGPVAWRIALKPDPVEEEVGGVSNLAAIVMIGFVIALFGGAALFAVEAAVAGLAMFAFVVVFCVIFNAFESGRKKTIERMGSVYVLAPSSRTWAGGAQPRA